MEKKMSMKKVLAALLISTILASTGYAALQYWVSFQTTIQVNPSITTDPLLLDLECPEINDSDTTTHLCNPVTLNNVTENPITIAFATGCMNADETVNEDIELWLQQAGGGKLETFSLPTGETEFQTVFRNIATIQQSGLISCTLEIVPAA